MSWWEAVKKILKIKRTDGYKWQFSLSWPMGRKIKREDKKK